MDEAEDRALNAERLFEARDKLESLTRKYIEKLQISSAEASKHADLLNTILNSIGDGVLVFDKDGSIMLANKAAIELAGWNLQSLSREEFAQMYDFFKEDGRTPIPDDEEPYSVAIREKRKAEIEGLVIGPHLPWRGMFIRAIAAPIVDKDGELNGVVTVVSDINERKQMQNQRDALTTLITHDLKNHLAAESLFLELLAEGFEDKLDEDDLKLLMELRLSNERYLAIASTLLEIHRTQIFTSKNSHSPIKFIDLMKQVIALDHHLADTRNIKVNMHMDDETITIAGVQTALQQVFHNVLQNALYLSPEGAEVDIRVKKSDNFACVEIEDRGPGIEQAKIETLFDHPVASNPLPTNQKSTSFGLYLTRLLIDAHGGKISCKSIVGMGTVFSIEIPLDKAYLNDYSNTPFRA